MFIWEEEAGAEARLVWSMGQADEGIGKTDERQNVFLNVCVRCEGEGENRAERRGGHQQVPSWCAGDCGTACCRGKRQLECGAEQGGGSLCNG